ncbi:hypothetical protein OIU85_009654 [Salix viminalis]|uniref:DUF4220 domain-containing protein n=1 Tax=Salix viminalis TaxID=40686 RepID=A0A9Q0NUY5_SALVM|nr:hypothetical protein OIU85_009654 [Salix viminalis]
MLKNLPEEVLNLWNNWEIRGMVLLSLLLQTILIISGPLRKTIARFWIRILVWSAYLSADMVATVALGNLATSQGDSSYDGSKKANNSIQAFWAPFLLLHLGGPDTITAYSIEDNELWLRHLLGLVVQVGSGFLCLLKVLGWRYPPIHSDPDIHCWHYKVLREDLGALVFMLEEFEKLFSLRFQEFCMNDLAPGYWDLTLSHFRFSKNSADSAFKVVEVELGLIYDMLYTKAPLIYSCSGIILRCISFVLSVTAFIIFQVKIEKHAYSSIDVAITYLLLAASVFLELYAFLCLVLSDRTMIWLLDRGNALTSAIYSRLRKLTTSKRWSRSISQYNLIRVFALKTKPLKCLKLVGIDEMMRQMHRGDGVLEREGQLKNFKWCTTEVEFSRSILIWHFATEICYHKTINVDKDDASNVSTSKCLSEYMMYLLVIRPNMLSKGFDKDSVVDGGPVLAKQLLESISESKKRWEMIEEVWMEMLTYAAAHCPWKEHAHALRRGGELLTHVCFLMLHLGLSQQYEYNSSEEYWVSIPKTFLKYIGR